ncbi:MAG TPA: PAC2 family protein [Trebonia sp.]|jgi:proteasome assembly chaperone (PAC2) family protein|nr:PAC2 family protein [Trebonia sp.]
MQQPEELYELDLATPDVDGAAMLVYLEGFMDAGAAGRLLTEHLLEAFEHQTVARFDTDRLLDYRSRRPLMTFSKDRWESYERPELSVYLLTDAKDKPFLLLTGPEPDHEWELFAAAVRSLADRLGAGPAITYFGVPMGIPHTRPLGVLAHATRSGLVTSRIQMPSKLQVPSSAAALLEFRFGEAGRDAIGFACQVPHYLSQAAYPTAALALLDSVCEVTGLDLPALELREAADRTNALIDRQVAESAEVAELVHGLEQQYDAAAEAADGGDLLADGEEMPTADELAAQFEQFLAEQQRGEGPER